MYDAIVVGARCAGAPAAMLPARGGYRVLLVDRGAFPSDIMSTHYIHETGTARLAAWGLLERAVASNCPPISTVTVDFGPFALTGAPPAADGAPHYAICPRRTALDTILVEAAMAAGAELRERFTVDGLLWDGDRVAGIRGHARGGALVAERARVVIGADGLRSVVARGVAAATYRATPPLTCGYYAYWSGVPLPGAALFPRAGHRVFAFPTNDGLTCIAAQWPHAEFHAVRADIAGNFAATLDEVSPPFAEAVRAGWREERFVGTADLPNFFRASHGPSWALVGDAGYHQDPNTGQGITNAFRDAELLADALAAGLAGAAPLDAALADYERRRNEAATPYYDYSLERASLQPPTEQARQPARHRPAVGRCRGDGLTRRVLRRGERRADHRRGRDGAAGRRRLTGRAAKAAVRRRGPARAARCAMLPAPAALTGRPRGRRGWRRTGGTRRGCARRWTTWPRSPRSARRWLGSTRPVRRAPSSPRKPRCRGRSRDRRSASWPGRSTR
ncbi:MAG TPA: NAD(P)/FAD-dependent oxidoreductase [Thermomicrobiales bacterium]|nr:NAD(P)/FAD-dependent oxidoreductase [Thermomicrobiales bacterium]